MQFHTFHRQTGVLISLAVLRLPSRARNSVGMSIQRGPRLLRRRLPTPARTGMRSAETPKR